MDECRKHKTDKVNKIKNLLWFDEKDSSSILINGFRINICKSRHGNWLLSCDELGIRNYGLDCDKIDDAKKAALVFTLKRIINKVEILQSVMGLLVNELDL